MANISNIIEEFILQALGEDDSIEISRNSLADYFCCAPLSLIHI